MIDEILLASYGVSSVVAFRHEGYQVQHKKATAPGPSLEASERIKRCTWNYSCHGCECLCGKSLGGHIGFPSLIPRSCTGYRPKDPGRHYRVDYTVDWVEAVAKSVFWPFKLGAHGIKKTGFRFFKPVLESKEAKASRKRIENEAYTLQLEADNAALQKEIEELQK